jgi:hypothetical protein
VTDPALYDMIGRWYAGMVGEVPTMVEDET